MQKFKKKNKIFTMDADQRGELFKWVENFFIFLG